MSKPTAISILLLSSALAAAAHADDTASAALSQVVVTGQRVPEQNYQVPAVSSIGPLGNTADLDEPFSISILPQDLIENSQAVDFKDVSKYLPLVAYQEQQGPDILRPQTRGMQGGNFQNSKQDGMTMFVTVANAMEQYQQIEVVNGLSASLYGPANPSGMFNFVTKRPSGYEADEVTASYVSDSIGTVKADLGGRLDPGGIVSFRLNALYGSGVGYVDQSYQRRALGDLGIDVHPWARGVLELNYSDYSLLDQGFPGWFTYGETIRLPAAPDPQRVGYGQPYAGVNLRTQTATARFKQDLGANWHLIVGVLNQNAIRNINTPVNNLTASSGTYTASFANGFAPEFTITSDAVYLNGALETFGIAHDLTVGSAGYRASSYSVITPATAASVRLGSASIYAPMLFPEPAAGPPNVWRNYDSSDVYQQGVNFNDLLRLNQRWQLRVGVSQDWFQTNNFNNRSLPTTKYVNQGVSPSGSLIFKPAADMTTYFTYASALQAGDLAPGTAANAGISLPPYRSDEYELGYKAQLSGIELTAALFRIERPFATVDPTSHIFEISGQQVNRGLEMSAIGEIYTGLTLYGGVQLLDARLEHTPLPDTDDRIFVGAPKVKGNLLFEYRIAGLPGLVATFDYQFSGTRPEDDTNQYFAAGYNLFDVGARYSATVAGKPVTLRLAVDNLTNRFYWSTIGPSNLTGANSGNLLAHMGAPRTVLASISVNL